MNFNARCLRGQRPIIRESSARAFSPRVCVHACVGQYEEREGYELQIRSIAEASVAAAARKREREREREEREVKRVLESVDRFF